MSTAATIASSARFMIKITDLLVEDIPAEQFADRHGTTINHPAFVLGHLGYYVGVAMEFLGGDAGFDPNEASLYEHGAECLDEGMESSPIEFDRDQFPRFLSRILARVHRSEESAL